VEDVADKNSASSDKAPEPIRVWHVVPILEAFAAARQRRGLDANIFSSTLLSRRQIYLPNSINIG